MKSSTIALLMALGVALVALWFFNTHHKVESERYVGPHGEARFNEHLAARMLLNELQLDAESVATLTPTEWMPDVNDTLFLRLNASMTLGQEQAVLLDWVGDGGNLILLPPRQRVLDTDRFLADFGFSLVDLEEPIPVAEEAEEAEEAATRSETGKRNRKRSDSTDEYALESTWQAAKIELDDAAAEFSVVRFRDSIVAARRDWGAGYVTLFADDYFANDYIGDGDNGRLLLDVVAGDIEPNKIWMVYQTTFSPLWELIWLNAPYLVIGLFVLFALWLWSVMPTFGPRVVAVADDRRSIIEHISAAGIFMWRRNGGDALSKSATEALVSQAESRHIGIGRLSPQAQAEAIARITGMSAQKVMDILSGPSGHRPRDFTHSMQKLQSIRKEL